MKKLKLFFALFAMLALGVTNAWGETATLAISSSVTANGTLTDDGGNSWSVTSDGSYNAQTKYIQVGTNKKTVTYLKLSTSAFSSKNISKIQVWATSKASTNVTAKVYIGGNLLGTSSAYTTQNAADGGAEYSVANSNNYTGDILVEISRPTAATGAIYFNKAIVTYTEGGSTQPTLSSIEISGDLTNKTYEEGVELDLTGLTVQANYESGDPKDITNEVEWSYTPNPLTKGTTSVEVTATYEDKTATKTINDLIVNEHIITPGAYDITLNNVFFGTTASANITGPVTGKQNDITITINGTGSTKPRTDATYTRFYTSSTMAISVPSGYVIKSIAITKNESDYANPSVTIGAFDNSTKTWTGTANSVTMSFSAKSFINSIKVTYAVDVKYAVNITTPSNGTLVVKDGSTVLADGAQVYEGTKLVVTPTPNAGYVFESLTVDGTPVDLTEGSYTFNMPAADVTIAATFKENEKPAATLTLSKNEVVEPFPGSWKQDDVVTLPSITSDCVKEFVGWSANPTCNVAPEYAAGDSYTLAATAQTLYAVYATVGTGETLTITPSAVSGSEDPYTFTIDATGYSLTAKKNSGSTAPTYTSNEVRVYAKGTVTLTAPKAIGTIVFNISTNGQKRLAPITASVGTIATQASGDATVTWTGDATEVTFTVGDIAEFGSENTKAGQLCFGTIIVTTAGSYSDYFTTCAAAPKAEVNPTAVSATAAGSNDKVEVTYENVNTESVAVALFNDAACTEGFTADWLTVSLDGDKNVTYTISANTLYTERKAYIKLTAPETTGATDPAVVVIPVTQAGKDKVFASLAELVAADLAKDDAVTVTLTNDVIKEFYVYNSKRAGVVFDVQKDGKDIKIYFNSQTTIDDWAVGGKLSGTLTNIKWTTYSSAWQLAPANTWAWANLTYTEPKAVSTVVVSGAPTKTTYVDGEAFDPAGLTVTVNYNDATSEVNPTGVTFNVTPATLTNGQTSVNVTATYNSILSAAYEVTGLTVNDIPTKTVAEFIASEGGRCYLEGIVSNITNTTYGNFDLKDASGKIYIYGCLDASGVAQKFATLGVKEGDKIKVIADVYELYQGTKQEAKNVQYVSHISAATINIADITMEVGETKTIAATLDPAEAEVTYTIKENTAGAISLSGNTITALKEGTATITAIVAEGADYLGTTKDFTVTVTPQNIATLPFEFDGKQADIANILGMSHSGIDESDYNDSPYLKMNTTGDWLIIHFNERPGELTYDIKANTGNAQAFSGTFTVQESADGVTYRNLAVYTTINTTKEPKTHNCFDKDTRYIKFIFTTKGNGNVALGNIKIEKSVVTKVTPTVVANSYFSVGNGEFVQFSTGNLQYEVGTNTWSFASDQYEVIGGEAYDPANPTNTNYGMNVPGYTGKLDLFAWSCDDKYGVKPSNADADYTGGFADWGDLVSEAGWSTLTRAQMEYLLERKKDGKKLWGLATLEGKVALILLPDNWNTAIEFTYGYVPTKWNFTANELTKEDWNNLEANGAVLLPAGGSRAGGYGNEIGFDGETVETDATKLDANGDYFHVDNVGDYGYYWLSSTAGELADYLILPASDNTGANTYSPDVWSREKRRGNSVRLVKKVTPDYTREVRPGYYGTICLQNGGQMIGASLFELYYYNEAQGLLYMVGEADATMEAGNPYVFLPNERATNNTLYVFYDETTATAKTVNGLVGYLGDENKQLEGNGTNYILQDNKIKKVVGGNNSNVFVTKNRAYIELGSVDKNEPAPVPGRRLVAIGQAPQVATGMESVDASAQPVKMIINGQLFILRGEKMYDAQGKLVK